MLGTNPQPLHRPPLSAAEAFAFGTKAETLARLKPLVRESEVLDLFHFRVEDWAADRLAILDAVVERFGGAALAVRSSAIGEDSAADSQAGAHHSCLEVDGSDRAAVAAAIERVIASYSGNPRDQVLVQPMLTDVAVSGVIMSHDMERGAPFYVLNYDDESGQTDSVTGGAGAHKAVLVFRYLEQDYVESERVRRILAMTRELEEICGAVPLDIEFAMAPSGELYLLQVRRISLTGSWLSGTGKRVSKRLEYVDEFISQRCRPRPGLAGSRTVLGVMPDWNPAEIIGTTPRPLAASLYRELVTRQVWRQARARMGYRAMPSEELMVMIGGHPYIDVRNSFNSLLPNGLDEAIANRLVDAYLDRLDEQPELHDKVEFEVAHTCMDFAFDREVRERYGEVLRDSEVKRLRAALCAVTESCLEPGAEGTLALSLQAIDGLEARQRQRQIKEAVSLRQARPAEALMRAADLIDECRTSGTLPFSIIARHAFIAESLLRSAVRRGAIEADRVQAFKRSVRTVSGELTADFAAVCRAELDAAVFLFRYGHLRPGTYDIMSLRYDERDDLFNDSLLPDEAASQPRFALTPDERQGLDSLLGEAGLGRTDADGLFSYAHKAIAGREFAKFVFTQNLSDALQAIVRWGEHLGLSRDDLSHIELPAMLDTLMDPILDDADLHFLDLAEQGRRRVANAQALKLSYLIRDSRDVFVVPLHRSAPNFVGAAKLEGHTVSLDSLTPASVSLYQKIVCIENADPGFDWIFTKGIKGLVTKYGGANSHMAIRCAEFGLPAAIGCGERTFERLVEAGRIELNCADKVLRPVHGE
jgi:hypothetical protein